MFFSCTAHAESFIRAARPLLPSELKYGTAQPADWIYSEMGQSQVLNHFCSIGEPWFYLNLCTAMVFVQVSLRFHILDDKHHGLP